MAAPDRLDSLPQAIPAIGVQVGAVVLPSTLEWNDMIQVDARSLMALLADWLLCEHPRKQVIPEQVFVSLTLLVDLAPTAVNDRRRARLM
jgi:hypothetical protein